MELSSKDAAPAHSSGEGLVSHLLHSPQDTPETDLTVTWVELDPNSAQGTHARDPEQVYVIVEGSGVMAVDGEQRAVEAGDLVYVPPHTEHRLRNTENRTLEAISAATPAFSSDALAAFDPETDEGS